MNQLKMYWPRVKPEEVTIPRDMKLRRFDVNNYESDVESWLDICKHGLISEESDASLFKSCMEDYSDLELSKIFFIKCGDEDIATITPVIHKDRKEGYIHMVACKGNQRGKGIGKLLNNIALEEIYYSGCNYAILTTDDFRLAAIKGYINAGFYPVIYGSTDEEISETAERWRKVYKDLGIYVDKCYDGDYSEKSLGSFDSL